MTKSAKSATFVLFQIRRMGALFCLFFLFMVPDVLALSNQFPTRDEVSNQLNILNNNNNLSPEDKLIKDDLMHTLEYMDKINDVAQERLALEQQPAQIQSETSNLITLNQADNLLPTPDKLRSQSIKQLESLLSDITNRLQIAQESLFSYSSQLASLQTLPERAQSIIQDLTHQQVALQNQLSDLSSSSNVRPTERLMLVNQQSFLDVQRALEFKKLDINTQLSRLVQMRNDYLSVYINKLQSTVFELQAELNTKRLNLSKSIIEDEHLAGDVKQHPLINQELEAIDRIGQRLNTVTNDTNRLVEENIRVRGGLNNVQEVQRNLNIQINMFRGTLLLSRLLYQQQKNFQSEVLVQDLHIDNIRIEKFNISQNINTLFDSEKYVNNLLVSQSAEQQSSELRETLNKIVMVRLELLEQLNEQLGNQLTQSIKLQINQQQLIEINTAIWRTLTQQIFWVSSNKPMNLSWLTDFPAAAKQQLKTTDLSISSDALMQGVKNSIGYLLLILFGIGVIYWRMRSINRSLARLSAEVGHFQDNQINTPKAIYLTLIKALPGALMILAVGLVCLKSNSSISHFCWRLSLELALFWFVCAFIWHSLSPKGIVEHHFAFPAQHCIQYRRQTLWLSLTILPFIFWSVLGEQNPLWLMDDVIGQAIILFILILLCVQIFPVCRRYLQQGHSLTIRLSVVGIVAVVPLIFIVLMVLGYFYTTLRLASRWIDSLYLLIAWNYIFLTTLCVLRVAAQKLAHRRAVVRRQDLTQEENGDDDPTPIEEPQLAMEQINHQSLRIINMVFFLIFAVLFYWIWSDLIVDLSYLYGITLWNYDAVVSGNAMLQSVTLGSLLVCLAILVVSYIMMRNLPGLLEVSVLSRLQLRPGTSYAITAVLTYLIAVIGIMIALGRLGISWDKLQWLAAALSVGLGFGLQEILANFVSGLIILFERPIRIGDTITIGTYSGKVSKIHIRATTIIDFDRKEVIIPNKSFVTERLINWTLSDTVTRVSIKLGVAYGSDLDKVKSVLLQAMKMNPHVLPEPEPQVLFLNFGDSTLDHELRFYVGELKYRTRTVDELNRTIDALCRENNIDIAFNQLEVHLHQPQDIEADNSASGRQ
ncbi:mechanosensitive channel MscK [Pragia fontium]|uniref:Potassium efflux system protein n=1 Tax=Pragia fontium DSM 5563 = ATCC 49100 TaxID=1122977 RepID=A0AAJ4W9V2_9GAMM|nr:mechanosensitive channel MscK [Pragia fontium]SFC63458.1 potassium efflux system protein [Pragia fontium DSM 5563 = ATCC 49100]